jgi:hypothetical protein
MSVPQTDSDRRKYGYETMATYTTYTCQPDCVCGVKERSAYDVMQSQLYGEDKVQSIKSIIPCVTQEYKNTWKMT